MKIYAVKKRARKNPLDCDSVKAKIGWYLIYFKLSALTIVCTSHTHTYSGYILSTSQC